MCGLPRYDSGVEPIPHDEKTRDDTAMSFQAPTLTPYGEHAHDGIASRLRTEGGFWLPNRIVDADLAAIKPAGLILYCNLVRCLTQRDYPSPGALAEKLGTTVSKVWQLVEVLYQRGLLNDSDIVCLQNQAEDQPNDEDSAAPTESAGQDRQL